MSTVFIPTSSQRVAAIVKASRPLGWVFAPTLFAVGAIQSRKLPQSRAEILRALLQIASLTFPLCIIVFGINDVYDYDTDTRNPRKSENGAQGTILHPAFHSDVRLVAWICTPIVIGCALLTGRRQNVLATASLVLLGWQYSAPPLRLKEVPILDSLSNGLMVLVGLAIGFSFGGASPADLPPKAYTMAIVVSGIHALAAVADASADATVGQTTIATYLGESVTAALTVATFVIGLLGKDLGLVLRVYLVGGLGAAVIVAVNVNAARWAFKAIIYWTAVIASIWFGVQGKSVVDRVLSAKRS